MMNGQLNAKNQVNAVKTQTKLLIPRNRQLIHPQIATTTVVNCQAMCGKIIQLKLQLVTSARGKVTGNLFASPHTL